MKYVYVFVADNNIGPGMTIEEIKRTIEISGQLVRNGFMPMIPTLLCWVRFVGDLKMEEWERYCRAWVEKCDCVLLQNNVLPGTITSKILDHADKLNKPIMNMNQILASKFEDGLCGP